MTDSCCRFSFFMGEAPADVKQQQKCFSGGQWGSSSGGDAAD
jgi:hypothetical protein